MRSVYGTLIEKSTRFCNGPCAKAVSDIPMINIPAESLLMTFLFLIIFPPSLILWASTVPQRTIGTLGGTHTMKRYFLLLCISLTALAVSARADVKLPAVISDGMV